MWEQARKDTCKIAKNTNRCIRPTIPILSSPLPAEQSKKTSMLKKILVLCTMAAGLFVMSSQYGQLRADERFHSDAERAWFRGVADSLSLIHI